jgi:hypothetical protein
MKKIVFRSYVCCSPLLILISFWIWGHPLLDCSSSVLCLLQSSSSATSAFFWSSSIADFSFGSCLSRSAWQRFPLPALAHPDFWFCCCRLILSIAWSSRQFGSSLLVNSCHWFCHFPFPGWFSFYVSLLSSLPMPEMPTGSGICLLVLGLILY